MTDTPPDRSRGSIRVARSLWYTGPGEAQIRTERLAPAPPDWLTIETHYSGISRGTERLVSSGHVPQSEWQRMRAPFQSGDFPFPVKYGYSAAGVVVDGPAEWIGRNTFALHPHQDVISLPASSVTLLPDGVPLKRATLAANMETALNAIWDSEAGPGDTIVIVGGGVVGLLIAFLAARLPGAQVQVIDIDENRRTAAAELGASFAMPSDAGTSASQDGYEATANADVVFHTSGSEAGIAASINACGFEATLVEISWYGDQMINVHLGGPFHAKRLRLISSQVGHVAARRRARWSHTRRLKTAAGLLCDPRLDTLVGPTINFAAVPEHLAEMLNGSGGSVSSVIAYPAAT